MIGKKVKYQVEYVNLFFLSVRILKNYVIVWKIIRLDFMMNQSKSKNYLLLFVWLNIAILDVVAIWHFVFIFSGSYSDEQVVMLDVLSLQISIFEMFLVVIGIALAALGIWGYQTIRNSISTEIDKKVSQSTENKVNEILDKVGYKYDRVEMSQMVKTNKKEEENDRENRFS